jgi:tRNA-dihydrouridine synthase
VLGSGDCIEPEQVVERMNGGAVSGVLVGRGVLRNPWILAQAADLAAGRPAREITMEDRGRFLLDYIDLLLNEGDNEPEGFRHYAGTSPVPPALSRVEGSERSESRGESQRRRERWVVNKMRALMSWYSKGLDNGSHLRLAINSCESISEARDIIGEFFGLAVPARQPL